MKSVTTPQFWKVFEKLDIGNQEKARHVYKFWKENPITQAFNSKEAIYRYSSENGFPMVQLGPGVLTLNTTDDYYVWEDYSKEVKSLTNRFFSVYDFSSSD